MPNAVITTQNFTGDGTQAFFLAQLSTAMQLCGFTQLAIFVHDGTNRAGVWQFDTNPSATYGKMIVEARFTSALSVAIGGYSAFNTGTNTGTDYRQFGINWSNSLSLSGSFTIYTCQHPEVRGCALVAGGSAKLFLGYFRPPLPAYWGDAAPFGFVPNVISAFGGWSTEAVGTVSVLTLSGYTQSNRINGLQGNAQGNPANNNRRTASGASVMQASQNFEIAPFSSDCIMFGANGMPILEIAQITPGVEEYALFDAPGNTATPRFGVRVI